MATTHEQLRTALADRYDVGQRLAIGGMATIYAAHDRKHDRRVALKVLKDDLAATVGADRFLREVRLAARLTHPHILPLYDSGSFGQSLFYVMPFVEGESLRDYLTREHQLAIPDAVRLACEVGEALDYAHRQSIVHRDIKPENILLVDGHAVVADFGIARALDSEDQHLTATGVSVGTPAYMSPEQAAGERADARSDIYSLGCVLYEMLAGQAPFTGASMQAVIARHMTDPVPPIRTVRPAVSPGLASVVERALAKTPADRFPTAAAFVAALRSSSVSSAEGSAESAVARPMPWRIRTVPAIVAALVLTGIAIGIAYARRSATDASFAGTTADASQRGPHRSIDIGWPYSPSRSRRSPTTISPTAFSPASRMHSRAHRTSRWSRVDRCAARERRGRRRARSAGSCRPAACWKERWPGAATHSQRTCDSSM